MLWHLQVGDSRGGGGGGGGGAGGGHTNFTSYGDWSEQMSSSGKKYYYNRYSDTLPRRRVVFWSN